MPQVHITELVAALAAVCSLMQAQTPPVAPVKPMVDDYYGTKVSDPYRYMENLQDPAVQSWFKAQNDYARAVLARIPGRQKLLARMVALDESTSADVTEVHRLPGDLYLYKKRLAKESLPKLYLRHGLDGEERLLIDPERVTVAAENRGKGKSAIDNFEMSNDGKYLAVGIIPGGSEHDTELHVFETASGRETGDIILHTWGDYAQWLPDNRSFVYGRMQTLPSGAPVTEMEQKYRAYLHVVGSDPGQDPAVFGYGVTPSIVVDPRYLSSVTISPDSNFAVGVIETGISPERLFYIAPVKAIGKPDIPWRRVADFADDVSDIATHGDDLYLRSLRNALRFKVMRTDARKPDLASAETIVPSTPAVVTDLSTAADALYVRVLDGGIGRLLRVPYGPAPNVEPVALPFEGDLSMATDPRIAGLLLPMTSWTRAPAIYIYNSSTKHVSDSKLQPGGPYDHPANLASEEVKVKSHDGTLVPLSIIHPRGMNLDGSNPTILAGYASYGSSQGPGFDRTYLAWHELGGIVAICHARGGGEYGEEWHLAGKGATKPNTWRDFIACAEYLIEKKYTSAAHLAGAGGSAGGILIGRAITERPELFRAAFIRVGILDTLRYETTANGAQNIPEFGSTKTEEGFKALSAMSPYNHVKDKTPYPAVLLDVGMNDPRVDPWLSGKMTARLQAATSSGRPILLRVDYASGHAGVGTTEQESNERFADVYSFLLWQLGSSGFQPER
jgi:prolyl oligopeptidase